MKSYFKAILRVLLFSMPGGSICKYFHSKFCLVLGFADFNPSLIDVRKIINAFCIVNYFWILFYSVFLGGSVVEMIKKALNFKFAKSTSVPVRKPLPVGEACIAKFPVDNLWYRAEVIAVYPEKVKVSKITWITMLYEIFPG